MAATAWNPENITDVAESVGILSLKPDVRNALSRDVEYRLAQVTEEALKFMKHAKRTILWSQDVANALRALDVEPLYGYDSTRALQYGEASIGIGQPLFYVEDEETDFERLINNPLPKVPREMSYTGHWLALEGVQPSVPQNPTANDSRHLELLQKGPNANPNLAAMANIESTTIKPQVKHILSQELQLYFEKVCKAVLDEQQEEYRLAGLSSLQNDPGLHQLVPYLFNFVAEKVTHNLKDLFVLTQMMNLVNALVRNTHHNIEPYIAALVPSVLTCLIGRNLGSGIVPLDHYDLRDLAGSILAHICRKYGKSSKALNPRLARTCLKAFLDPKKPFGTQYGGILGIRAAGENDALRVLIVPNLKDYESLIREDLITPGPRQVEAQKVMMAVLQVVNGLNEGRTELNGHTDEAAAGIWTRLNERVGESIGMIIAQQGRIQVAKEVLACF